ncbi:hypothetical protein C8R43DRAFT_297607 [Mycena crocata]|nr:hypothetical protein C8R43DRAFT_297607 [Mycena crocata]
MLSSDLLCMIIEGLTDNVTLGRCSLVNWEFNRAASRMLYSQVMLCPAYGQEYRGILDQVSSATLPHHAPHVQILRIGGYFTPPTATLDLPGTLLAAVNAFKNLHTVEILPETYPEALFTPILAELAIRDALANLRVNASCTDDVTAPVLVSIGGLRRLEVQSPSRAILRFLPEWLGRLLPLKELHLTNNCGSITPGVLRSFILPNIAVFSLGLSYSITDDDLFDFLGQLPCLETVQIRHYLQFKEPRRGTPLQRLRSLTVLHASYDSDDADRLCAWVRHAISGSCIERVRLCADEYDDSYFASTGFDALLEDISRLHPETMRILDLGGWLVSASALSLLCESCPALEELGAALDPDGFESFMRLVPLMKRLHTAVLQVYSENALSLSTEDASRIMQNSGVLRRLSVNDLRTEGSWVSQDDFVRFEVQDCSIKSINVNEQVHPTVTEPQNPPAMDAILEEEEEEE